MLVKGLLQLMGGKEVYLGRVGVLPIALVVEDGGEVDPCLHGHIIGGVHGGRLVVVVGERGGRVADDEPTIAGGAVKCILGRGDGARSEGGSLANFISSVD